MGKISIITDTTCDLSIDVLNNRGIGYIPLNVEINGVNYKDRITITTAEFYNKIKEKDAFPRTSLISPSDFEEVFQTELNSGNEVIYISVSSKLSGTYNSANIAKNNIRSEKINVIDSQTGSSGMAILVLEANRMVSQGLNSTEIIENISNLISRQKCMIYVENMEMLKRNGRIPPALAAIGNVFKIKPILTVKDGNVELFGKARGKKIAFKQISENILSEDIDLTYPIMVAHANNAEYATDIINLLKENLKNAKFIISELGPAMGSHSGESAIAIWVTIK